MSNSDELCERISDGSECLHTVALTDFCDQGIALREEVYC
jgi:hypothetical protein